MIIATTDENGTTVKLCCERCGLACVLKDGYVCCSQHGVDVLRLDWCHICNERVSRYHTTLDCGAAVALQKGALKAANEELKASLCKSAARITELDSTVVRLREALAAAEKKMIGVREGLEELESCASSERSERDLTIMNLNAALALLTAEVEKWKTLACGAHGPIHEPVDPQRKYG